MITLDDFNSIYSNRMEKKALSGTATGALGGAGLGLLVQALRPKDKDQSRFKEYLLSALTGAGLGAAAGFAYDNLGSNKFLPKEPKQPNSTEPTENYVPVPEQHIPKIGDKINTYAATKEEAKQYESELQDMIALGEKPETVYDVYNHGMIAAENGLPASGEFFIMYPEMYQALVNKDAMFAQSKGERLRIAAEKRLPVMIMPNGDIVAGYMSPKTGYLYPATQGRGILYRDNENIVQSALRSFAHTAGDVLAGIGSLAD